jgi:hypothetical protein
MFFLPHAGMLSPHFSDMSEERFRSLPNTTNAVESHNRLSKVDRPEILRIAMLTTYKVDMSVALEHMARSEGMLTSYDDTNEEAKGRKSKAHRKRKLESGDGEGPPDKSKHFKNVKHGQSILVTKLEVKNFV